MSEQVVTVTLIVKGDEPAAARRAAIRHLNEWVTQPPLSPDPSYGFPDGTLLYYSFGAGYDACADNEEHSRVAS